MFQSLDFFYLGYESNIGLSLVFVYQSLRSEDPDAARYSFKSLLLFYKALFLHHLVYAEKIPYLFQVNGLLQWENHFQTRQPELIKFFAHKSFGGGKRWKKYCKEENYIFIKHMYSYNLKDIHWWWTFKPKQTYADIQGWKAK